MKRQNSLNYDSLPTCCRGKDQAEEFMDFEGFLIRIFTQRHAEKTHSFVKNSVPIQGNRF